MGKLVFLVVLVFMASGMMASATQVNEASEAQKVLMKVVEEQLKMAELYSQISATMKSKNYEAPKRIQQVTCLPPGIPCIGWQGGNCCSNVCNHINPLFPAGICG